MSLRHITPILICLVSIVAAPSGSAGELPLVENVERQPLVAQVERLIEGLTFSGSPLDEATVDRLHAAMDIGNDAEAIRSIQEILDPHCLFEVHLNPESRVKIERGEAPAELVEQGWRGFLIKVSNEPGINPKLNITSRHAQPVMFPEGNLLTEADVSDRWMDLEQFTRQPMTEELSGLALEYRILQIFSRDPGKREGEIACDVGAGTQDLGFRATLPILFDVQPSVPVKLNVRDVDGSPTTGAFIIKDEQRRLYPYIAKRLEPDFFFHDQIYRHDGETVSLPPGTYEITYGRGPEYLTETKTAHVRPDVENEIEFKLERWIDPNTRSWFSGDHHIHASGCMHYKSPTLGVEPGAMMRHVLGEALNVGCVLTWGPAWYHQKQFFSTEIDPVSSDRHIIKYDVEVSGFPSDHCGHLVLLRLQEDDFPGTDEKQQWPSWDLPILKWAKAQGGVVGVAHSGWGLDVYPESRLPNYEIPPMDGIGAQEYLVDVAHDAIDFISTVDTPYVWELNIWYHTLNAGFETKISGETDFPCIYGDKVGLGRSYVKLADNRLSFDAWVEGIKQGRAYVSDGYSHLMDFAVEGVEPGGKEKSKLQLDSPQTVTVTVDAASWLEPVAPTVNIRQAGFESKASGRTERHQDISLSDVPYNRNDLVPYWHVERARIDGTREVMVEIVVNGMPVAAEAIRADGKIEAMKFEVPIERSGWVTARILPSAHTNPVFVEVGGEPVRPSRKSIQWCLDSIDQVWKKKSPNIREGRERDEAEVAFNRAREIYRQRLEESFDDN